jgi:hypothetical protein
MANVWLGNSSIAQTYTRPTQIRDW